MTQQRKLLLSFTNAERKGILVLVFLIIVLQILYCFLDFTPSPENESAKKQWLSLEKIIINTKQTPQRTFILQPFNPNFITDFKGYKLGMSVQEIDKLHSYRKSNKYVNSAKEFQLVTGVSDSLMTVIAPFFKFPEWINHRNDNARFEMVKKVKASIIKKDINIATAEDLIKIYGVGVITANKIIALRSSLGGFVLMEQLGDIWGMKPEVLKEISLNFFVPKQPPLQLVDVNNASRKELMQFYYFNYTLAKQIIIYRSMNGNFENIEDLSKIKGFPVDKAKIIALYLKF